VNSKEERVKKKDGKDRGQRTEVGGQRSEDGRLGGMSRKLKAQG
jgi:hypothetical protein